MSALLASRAWTFRCNRDSASSVPAEPAADPIGAVDFHFDIMCPWAYQASLWLWHLMTGWLEFPQLYEVQRPKSQQDLTAIAETFRPYLEARDWITIQKETP